MEGEPSVKDRILETARRVISEEGYSALSMRRVARDIGYSATAIYLYYDSKDELVHALIDEGMDRLYEALSRASDTEGDPTMRLEAIVRAYAQFALQNPEYYEIMFMLHPRPMERYPADRYRRARRNLELIAAAIEEVSPVGTTEETPRLRATTVWAAVHGAVALVLAGRVDASLTTGAVIDEMIRQVVSSVSAGRTGVES